MPSAEFVINPRTKRAIRVGGRTYKSLQKDTDCPWTLQSTTPAPSWQDPVGNATQASAMISHRNVDGGASSDPQASEFTHVSAPPAPPPPPPPLPSPPPHRHDASEELLPSAGVTTPSSALTPDAVGSRRVLTGDPLPRTSERVSCTDEQGMDDKDVEMKDASSVDTSKEAWLDLEMDRLLDTHGAALLRAYRDPQIDFLEFLRSLIWSPSRVNC